MNKNLAPSKPIQLYPHQLVIGPKACFYVQKHPY